MIGPFGSSFDTENYVENGEYRYIRGQDVKPFILQDSDNRYLPKEDYHRLSRYALRPKDILISVVGTLGNACIVQEKDVPAIFSCKSTVLRTNKIKPGYILTYLNCIYGKELLLRKERGAIQKGLNLDDLKVMLLPDASHSFQGIIDQLFYDAQNILTGSKSLYKEAEKLLLEELGELQYNDINNFGQVVSSVKSFKDSFKSTGRIDAEYYQPKYDLIEAQIKNYNGGFDYFSNLIQYIFTGEYSEEYKHVSADLKFYIRSTNIKGGQIEIDEDYFVEPSKFSKNVKTGDIITARVGTLGVFGEIESNLDNAICSDNVLCFRFPDSFMPDVYTLYLNSKINYELIDRLARGSVQQRLNQETLKEILIPIFPEDLQIEVSKKIQESFKLRKQSKMLLEAAKKAVEIAIEENEEAATEYLKTRSKLITE